MQSLNEITMEMKPHEKEIFFARQKVSANDEQKRLENQREEMKARREMFVSDLIKRTGWTREQLAGKGISEIKRLWERI